MSSIGQVRYFKCLGKKPLVIYVAPDYSVHVFVNTVLKPVRPVRTSKFYSYPMRPAARPVSSAPAPSAVMSSGPASKVDLQKQSCLVEEWKMRIQDSLMTSSSSATSTSSTDSAPTSSLVEQWKKQIQQSLWDLGTSSEAKSSSPTSSGYSSAHSDSESDDDVIPTPSTSSSPSRPPIHLVDFVFAPGVRNAPQAALKVIKLPLENSKDGFEIIVDPDSDKPTKPMKEFTQEELDRQLAILEEWKSKIQESLRQ